MDLLVGSAARALGWSSVKVPRAFTVEAWVKTTSTAGGRVIGFGDQGGSTFSTSSLDDVGVYSTALSSTHISAHYSAGATP